MSLQGPHHSAQKSTRTGTSDFSTSVSKESAETFLIPMGFLELSCSDAKNNTAGHREAQGTQAWMPPDGGAGGANAVAPYRAKARIQASFR